MMLRQDNFNVVSNKTLLGLESYCNMEYRNSLINSSENFSIGKPLLWLAVFSTTESLKIFWRIYRLNLRI